ncbi:zinc finger AN1 and C2H2 domain-containing stress-associated protein 16-like [Phalaenopsis equestris]|uniref:zinc finger AN1 and C2H2 domain-containing stress-associated protein 16-like n=1 Tax=Phalaenopsis equestris TaxID=78828 RepID=UPI0009E4FA4B|nr:zinc finger AN1 and C2H2 domain-containing stress-associated protein 16-like [Phalaenopsis equestris]
MSTTALADIGKRCGVEECKLIDFLPFNCDRCDQVFCLRHRSYTKHPCPVANQIDMTLLICPLCAQGVRLLPNEDPDITWDTHVNCDCDPSTYQKPSKKKLCPATECNETLFFSNTIRCKNCNQDHCLRHKFAANHNCTGPKKPDSSFPFLDVLRKSQKNISTPSRTPNGSAKLSSNLLNAASSIRASAEAGMQRLSIATKKVLRKAKDGMAQGRGELAEQCLQCQSRFGNVNALIEHVEKVHEDSVPQGLNMAAFDVCPVCNETFRDPVLLVEHVEEHHGDSTGLGS